MRVEPCVAVHYGKKQLAEQTSKIAALTDELKLRAFLSDTGERHVAFL